MRIVPLKKEHYNTVAAIYEEGLKTGIASFETKIPSWEEWDTKFLKNCRFVIFIDEEIAGWCALSAVSKRAVYQGVAENTVYVSNKFQKLGLGYHLLNHLILESEKADFWTLQASFFRQNTASIKLHLKCGFREIGFREKIAQRDGVWQDNIIMERRRLI